MHLSTFKSDGKFGYKDGLTIIIPAQYEAASSFNDGYAVAVQDNLFGIIDITGNFVVKNKYDDLYHLFANYYVARIDEGDDWRCGVINTDGEIVIEFQFKCIQSKSDRYFLCFENDKDIKEDVNDRSIHGRHSFKEPSGCQWYSSNGKFITSLNVEYHSDDYFIVKNQEGKFGLIKSDGTILISPKYPTLQHCVGNIFLITSESNEFSENSVINDSDEIILATSNRIKYENGFFKVITTNKETEWYSIDGNLIYSGDATPLSINHLKIYKNKKFGILNRQGRRIINFLYDEIIYVTSFFAVRRGDKLGLIGKTGEVIADTIYKSIESVCIENNPMLIVDADTLKRFSDIYNYKYAGYSNDYCFDTEEHVNYRGDKCDSLNREVITIAPLSYRDKTPSIKVSDKFDINSTLILDEGDSRELFTLSDGIVNNSKFDKIEQITPLCFIVSAGNKYGVFRLDEESLIIPIKYDRILFYGGHTVLLYQDGLWGAKSLLLGEDHLYSQSNVDIPVENLELYILDEMQTHFCVKKCYKDCKNKNIEYYTIVNNKGVEVERLREMHLDRPLKRFDKNHYLTTSKGKFGFVSEMGYISIPFIYDEIIPKKTGNFNVRIGNAWGVIDINGRELMSVKYDKPMPIYIATPNNIFFEYDDLKDEDDPFCNSEKSKNKYIVRDAISGYYGCINKAGEEIIPPVYEHLIFGKSENDSEISGNFVFFGFGGFESEVGTFFSYIRRATWGCLDKDGRIIIEPKYDCLKLTDHFIMAGRNGSFLADELGTEFGNGFKRYDNYSGVYDLYTHDGELVVGGFREMYYDNKNKILVLFFGGNWDRYCSYRDEWGNGHDYRYALEYGNDLWLILDENLNTIQRKEDGNPYSFNKGFIGEIEIREDDNEIYHIYNMPIDLMAKGFSRFGSNCVFIKENNLDHSKTAALDYHTGICTPFYDDILQITDTLFFVAEDNKIEGGRKVGICTINKIVLQLNYYMFTLPINGYFFAAKEYDKHYSTVELFHINDLNNPLCAAINKIKTIELINEIRYGRLLMFFDGGDELRNMKISRKVLFSKEFLDLINTDEAHGASRKCENHYCFPAAYGSTRHSRKLSSNFKMRR